MTIRIYREFNTGGLDTITIEWENHKRTWLTTNTIWNGIEIEPFSELDINCWNYTYQEVKTYKDKGTSISRTWTFLLEDAAITTKEFINK